MLKPLLRTALRGVFRILYRVEVKGDPLHLRQEKTLIVANHQSLLDGVLLGLFLPVDATFVVNTGIANKPFFRSVLRLSRYLTVDPTNPLAMKTVVARVNEGEPVVIFPEGRISVTGSLMKTYPGTGFVAARSQASVVPVSIEGALLTPFSYVKGLFPTHWFPKITLTIHPPHTIARAEGSAREARRKAGEDLHRVMQHMTLESRQRTTLFSALLHARARFGGAYMLIEDVRLQEESYNTLLKMALGAARLLLPHTRPGEAVGVLLPNSTGTLAAILGLTAFERIPALLNYSAGVGGVQAACHAAQVKTIVSSRLFIAKGGLEKLIAGLEPHCQILYVEDLKGRMGLSDKLWIGARMLAPHRLITPGNPDAAAVILFTSGSEGKPKGVVHSHNSLLANIAQVRASADFKPSDKFFLALPLFHSFGLTCGALLPVLAGCKLFLYPSPLHYRIIPELVYDRDATVLFGTSTFLGAYGKLAHPFDFARLRYVVAGAEKLSDAVRDLWFDKFGVRILVGYGTTECAPVLAVNTPMAARSGTVGKLLPGIQYHLEPVPGIAQGGALYVQGPNVMKGYLRYENPGVLEVPQALGRLGWYETGDIVSMDSDGFVRIEGRIKRFAKVAGEMVSLDVAEQVAVKASPLHQHAVLAQADPAKGESLLLLTTDAELNRAQLVAAAQALGAPELAVARNIRVVERIPVLGSGKTDYVSLQAQLAA
jgi:acyl-[acyl-carrier-protein]-phospholipid O-acyltransferase / long-chain-fatty-acid--[acyl-carrier-protein] ligase